MRRFTRWTTLACVALATGCAQQAASKPPKIQIPADACTGGGPRHVFYIKFKDDKPKCPDKSEVKDENHASNEPCTTVNDPKGCVPVHIDPDKYVPVCVKVKDAGGGHDFEIPEDTQASIFKPVSGKDTYVIDPSGVMVPTGVQLLMRFSIRGIGCTEPPLDPTIIIEH